jgi:endogenous inhibitor of DNA gyrase (YacG/DUF329 family)
VSEKKELKVACPGCKKEFNYYDKKTRPFCSSECRDLDFIDWTEGERSIPSKDELSEEDLQKVIISRQNEIH